MRCLTIMTIFAYAALALLGVVVLAHPAHSICPFGSASGDCALLSSLGGTLKHIGDFWLALAALPILAIAFTATSPSFSFLNLILPPVPLARVYVAPDAHCAVLRRRRWLILFSSYA